MLIPHNADVAMERVPYANWAIMFITAAASVFFWLQPEALAGYLVLQRGSDFSFVQLVGGQLGHGGVFHLLGNLTLLFALGNAVNAKLGHGRFLLLYFGAALVGDLLWLALGQGTALLGASGAVMGVAGAFLMLYPRNNISIMTWQVALLVLLLPLGLIVKLVALVGALRLAVRGGWWNIEFSACWLILLYMGFDILFLALGVEDGVGHGCHLAGFAVGLLAAWALLRAGALATPRHEENLLQALGLQPKAPRRGREIGAWKRRLEASYALPQAFSSPAISGRARSPRARKSVRFDRRGAEPPRFSAGASEARDRFSLCPAEDQTEPSDDAPGLRSRPLNAPARPGRGSS